MTYGQGYESGNGWHPPPDPEPTLYGRRRPPDGEADPGRDQPYRGHRAAEEDSWPPLTDRYVPRPHTGTARVPPPESPPRPEREQGLHPMAPAPDTGNWEVPRPPAHIGFPPSTGGFATGGGVASGGFPAPVDPLERTHWRDPDPVPQQWDEPDLDLPDRRRRTGESGFDRAARHGEAVAPPRRRGSPWLTALGLLAVAVLVAVVAAGGYFMFVGRGPAGPADTGPKQHDISNRTADPAPLTEAEVFPAPTVATGYQMLKAQATNDCKTAAVGEPVKMLAIQDCTQVVRAALLSADKVYVVTAGVFNFGTQVNAEQASESIRSSVGAQKGRFTGYNLGSPPSDVYARAPTQLGWDVRGHFLAFCVIARVDAKAIGDADPGLHQIIDELVEKYLINTVLQARVTPPSPAPSGAKPSGK
jgi:hypothetical protein